MDSLEEEPQYRRRSSSSSPAWSAGSSGRRRRPWSWRSGALGLVALVALHRPQPGLALKQSFQRKSFLYSGNLLLVVVLVLAILGLVNYFLSKHNYRSGLHRGQAPQPVRPVGLRPQGPQDGHRLQVLLPRGQPRPGGHGEPAQDLRLPFGPDHVRVHRPGQEPGPGQALRRHPGRDDDHRGRRQGEPHHDDHRGGRHQRPDQGHPGPEEDHLLPRGPRRGVRSTKRATTASRPSRPSSRSSATRSRSRAWPWPTGSPRTAPCSSSPARRRTSCRTNTRRSGPTSRTAAASSSWSTRRRPRPLPLFLADYGFKLENDIVVDTVSRLLGGDYFMPVVSEYEPHAITDKFGYATFFPFARSVEIAETKPEGATLTALAKTSPNSWSEQAARPERGQVHAGQGQAGADRPGRRLELQDQARAARPRRSQARRAGAGRSRGQARSGRKGGPAGRHRRLRLRQEPLLRPVRATAISSSTSPTG